MKKLTGYAAALLVAIVFLIPTRAESCGGTLHIYMAELALNHVTTPDLKAFLERNKNTVLWGAWYPDSGYAGGNTYGEYSHWHTFLDGYADYIKNDVGPNHKDYEMLVANFLGASAHSIEDQAFDHLFLIKTEEMDGTGQAELDRGLDMVCMYECNRFDFKIPDEVMADPDKYTPIKHLGRVYEKLNAGYPSIEKQIFKGQRLLSLAIQGERLVAGIERFDVMRISPWGAANYMKAPGGIEHNAEIVAAYWESLWKMLHGEPGDFIISTFPHNGGATLSTDHNTVDSNVTIFLDRPYDKTSITPETFIVRDSDGKEIEGNFNWCYNSDVFRFKPAQDLTPGSTYEVTMTTGIKSVHGDNLSENYVFSFNTP